MRAIKLTIINIGKIEKSVIPIDKPLILFYGEIKQGKTTILNSVRWVCGGEFPDDIIRHGAEEGSIELELTGGMIARSWYRAKDKTVKARPVVFVRNGKPVSSPVSEIKRLLNPFLLDQDFLRNKTELERKQYFGELFAVNTSELDTELFNSQREATNLRAKIAGYGQIDLTPVAAVDVEAEKLKLAGIIQAYDLDCGKVETENDAIRIHNAMVERAENNKTDIESDLELHRKKVKELEAQLAAIKIPARKELLAKPAKPDTTTLEETVRDAGARNVRAEQYQANKKRADEKAADERKLSEMEARQRAIKKEKQAKLKDISDKCGVEGAGV
jgi:hypothetical protein